MKPIHYLMMLICTLLLLVSGCQPKNAATTGQTATTGNSFAVLTDGAGRKVTLSQKPQRVVVLSPSLMEMIDAAGGTVVGRPDAKTEQVPEGMRKVASVGHVYNVNIEKVVSLKPDLVIGNVKQHEKFRDILESNHIPVIYLQPKTYDEVKACFAVIGQVYGTKDVVDKKIAAMDRSIDEIRSNLPKTQEKIVILHATPSNVSVELENSIAGCVAKMLGFTNVASGSKAIDGKPDKTPYSMEALVEKDPDVLFITSMGDHAKIEARLKKDVQGNPAWNSLRAVKNGKVYVLPERLFLLNPGLKYPEAVRFMAKDVFPEAVK